MGTHVKMHAHSVSQLLDHKDSFLLLFRTNFVVQSFMCSNNRNIKMVIILRVENGYPCNNAYL